VLGRRSEGEEMEDAGQTDAEPIGTFNHVLRSRSYDSPARQGQLASAFRPSHAGDHEQRLRGGRLRVGQQDLGQLAPVGRRHRTSRRLGRTPVRHQQVSTVQAGSLTSRSSAGLYVHSTWYSVVIRGGGIGAGVRGPSVASASPVLTRAMRRWSHVGHSNEIFDRSELQAVQRLP
jgi:hypothetical protein